MTYEGEATSFIMQIKTNIENGEVISEEALNNILSVLLSEIKAKRILDIQLDYALSTGGEFLERKYIEINH